jgi:type III restriction enzyme
MLREGFDVNNICVIVPLRASQAPILLEQTLGRGLRLMWREPEYDDIKAENRDLLYVRKQAPKSLHDILYVVEHPAFEQYYKELGDDLFATDEREDLPQGKILGDMIDVGLKENYKDYDLYIPIIKKDKEETLKDNELSVGQLRKYDIYSLAQLKSFVPNNNDETFVTEEIKVGTRFGEYKVTGNLFSATSYNEYLQRMMTAVSSNMTRTGKRSSHSYPFMQINQVSLIRSIDKYIRNGLFGESFNPLENNNWRVLMIAKKGIVEHIMKQLSEIIYAMQNNIDIRDAVVEKHRFSEVSKLKMRENFALDIVKSIYEKTAYPSNKGLFEKDFMETCDKDSEVESLIKINEHRHTFAHLRYIRADGMLSSYYPDFMVKIADRIFVVETKSAKDATGDQNVQAKRRGALDWIAIIIFILIFAACSQKRDKYVEPHHSRQANEYK